MSAAKKLKLDDSEGPSEKMRPILPEELTEDTPLTEVYVDKIKDPKTISIVVISLNSCLPVMELSHLKRIKSKEVMLFPVANDIATNQVHEYLKSKNFNVNLLSGEVRIALVAKIPPKTKRQHTKVNQLWPCNFHSDKYLEKLTTNTLFNDLEVLEHKSYMQIAISVVSQAIKLGLTKYNQGVIIVDPTIKSVVALGYSECHINHIKHAVMVAIDNGAKTQNGGAWVSYQPSKDPSSLNLCGFHPELLVHLKQQFQEATFGATWFKGKDEITEPSDGPYLCTGYYVYSTREPCVMCAMALVHSRVKRVFYGMKSQNGGLGSLCKVHTVKDLNHHYEVFAGLCEDECKDLSAHP